MTISARGKPEKARTSPFLVAPLWPCVAGGQNGQGCLFRPPFFWFISFGGAKEMNKIILGKKKSHREAELGATWKENYINVIKNRISFVLP